MIAMAIITAIVCVLVVLFLVVRVKKGGVLGVITKTVASLGFVCLAGAGMYYKAMNSGFQAISIFIMLGLVFGLIGDVTLDLKVVYPQDNLLYQNAGMISFAVGHVFYITALSIYGAALTPVVTPSLISLAIALPIGVGIIVAGKPLLKFNYGKFFVHSLIYSVELFFTTAFALALYVVTKSNGLLIFAVGMILFLISDLILSNQYYGKEKLLSNKFLIVTNHLTYYAAQILLALFIFYM